MKKILSILLCAAMLIGCIGTISFAEEEKTIFTTETLEGYCVYSGELASDGYIGIPVGIKTYTKGATTTDTPLIIYVVNTNTKRVGTESDEALIQSFLDRDYIVVVLDYFGNEKAVYPEIDWSVQGIKTAIRTTDEGKAYLAGNSFSTTYDYVLPAGYNLERQMVYWSYDLHGADGLFDFVMSSWNNDFLGIHGQQRITLKDGTVTTVKEYTESLPGGKVTSIEQCINKDGSFINMDLYMDIIYPAKPEAEVPVLMYAQSSQDTVGTWNRAHRPHMSGFLFRGYAGALFDYPYMPMARNDHYGYYDGNGAGGQTGWVTGDNNTFSLGAGSQQQSCTAAVRLMRYLADREPEKYKFDADNYGLVCISKTSNTNRLGNPNVENLPERRFYEGHYGETRYENGLTEDILDSDGNVIVRGGEEQPWLTYNDGSKIPSNVQCVYSTSGGARDAVAEGSAPMYLSGTQADGGCYFNSYPEMMTACYRFDIPTLGYTCPNVGHDFCIGADGIYGNDTYLALFEFFDYYLRDTNARCEYIAPINGAKDVEATAEITVKFNAPVSEAEISKVSIVNNSTGEAAVGSWSACYGSTEWIFTPHNLKGGYTYTVNVPNSIKAENGKEIRAGKASSFTVKPEKAILAAVVGSTDDSMTADTQNGVYFEFEEADFSNSTTTAIRFSAINDAANNALIYSAVSDGEGGYTEGELLGKVNLLGAGDYDFDVTDYVNSLENGEKAAFIIKAEKESGEFVLLDANYNSTAIGNRSMLKSSVGGGVTDEMSYTDGGRSVKVLGNPINEEFAPYHYYYDNSATTIQHRIPSTYTEADYGRKFKASFYINDSTERQFFISSGDLSANGEINTAGYRYMFRTVKDEWKAYEYDYRIDSPYTDYNQNKFAIAFEMFGAAAEQYPLYFDDLKITEYVTDIEIAEAASENSAAPSLILHPADKVSSTALSAAYVENSNADKSFEDENTLRVSGRNSGAYADRNVYAVLELADIADTAKVPVTINVLSNNTGTINVYGISDKEICDSWNAESASYINAPAFNRFAHGPVLDKVYNSAPIGTISVTAPGCYSVDASEYAAYMKELGAGKGLLMFTAATENSNINFEFADETTNPDAYLKVIDFDKKTSFVHAREKPEVTTAGDIRIGSQGTCTYSLDSLTDRTSTSGKSLKLYLGESYTTFKFYNIFDHILTADDKGRRFNISFWAKSDMEGAINVGFTSCQRPADGCEYTDYFATFYVSEEKTLTAGEWQKISFDVTVTEEMAGEYYVGYESAYINPAMFTIGCTKSIKGATVYIDDLVVREIVEITEDEEAPEPYTYSYDFEKADSSAYYWNGFENRNTKAYWTNTEGENHTENGSGCVRILTDKTYNRFWLSKVIDGLTDNTESGSLEEGDIGRTFKVGVWFKSDTAGSFTMRTASKRNGKYSYDGAIEKTVAVGEGDVGVWRRAEFEFTVDEAMVENGVDTVVIVFDGFGQATSSSAVVTNTCMIYFDDVTSEECVVTGISENISSAVALSPYKDGSADIGVNTSGSAAVRGIKKAYLRFEGGEYEDVQRAKLNINVAKAGGQTIKVYGLIGSTYPGEALTYSNAPATNSDESMNKSLVYGGAALDEITVTDSGIYSFDVTQYVKSQGSEECIFVITSEDNGDIEYVSLDFSTYPMTENIDYVSDAAVDFTGGIANVTGSKITLLNVFGNGNEAVSAGKTYKISADVTLNADGDVYIGLAEADGASGESAVYSLAAGTASTVTFEYTATEEDVANGICAVFIEAVNAGFTVDNVTVLSDNTVELSKDAELLVEVAEKVAVGEQVTINISTVGGSSVSVGGVSKGATATEEVYAGSVLDLSADGDGEFMFWVDANSNTILSYDESFSFTVGSDRSVAAVYADNTDVFVTFTSMGNKLVSAGLASAIEVPADPYVYGYTFKGWYANGEKAEFTAGGAVTAEANTEYKAGFMKESATYKVTVNGEEKSYTYNEKVTVTADAEKDGKNFSYWKRDNEIVSYNAEYSFYVSGNTTVDAVYGESVTAKAVLVMATPVLVEGNKIAFFAERDIPADCELIETGILLDTKADVSLDKYTNKAIAKSMTNKGQYTIRKTNVSSEDTWYGVAYAIYRDTNGSIVTAYSNEVSYTVE